MPTKVTVHADIHINEDLEGIDAFNVRSLSTMTPVISVGYGASLYMSRKKMGEFAYHIMAFLHANPEPASGPKAIDPEMPF